MVVRRPQTFELEAWLVLIFLGLNFYLRQLIKNSFSTIQTIMSIRTGNRSRVTCDQAFYFLFYGVEGRKVSLYPFPPFALNTLPTLPAPRYPPPPKKNVLSQVKAGRRYEQFYKPCSVSSFSSLLIHVYLPV